MMYRETDVGLTYSVESPPGRALPARSESPAPDPSQDTDLAFVRLLWDHRRLLLRIVLYGLLVSAALAFLIAPRYESTTRLMPPDKQSGSGLAMAAAALSNESSGLGMLAGEFLGGSGSSDLTVGVLKSRTLQDRLVKEFNLQHVYGVRHGADARKILDDNTRIVVDRKSQIITVTVTDGNPQRAASIAQGYSSELNRLLADLNTSSAHRERVFLESRLQEVNKDLEAAEQEFSQFASKNTAIDIKEQGRAMVTAAATLQGQLIAVESEYEGLKQIYTENNVRVRLLKARIDEIQRQLQKLGGKDVGNAAASDQQGDDLYPSIRKLPLLGVNYADLYRRTKIQEAVLETLTKEYEMAKVQEAKELPTIKVLDAADIPEHKSFPPRLFIMILGTFFSFAVGSAWIFCFDLWRQTDAHNPRKVFAQEVLSTLSARVPRFPLNGFGHGLNGRHAWKSQTPQNNDDLEESERS